jgi:DNA repair protein RecN (Recombination protein N)
MLRTLHITNYAIIDELHIEFSARLNVITGETGAGKSILMGALSLILGDRADTSVLLDREKKCVVEGVFTNVHAAAIRSVMQEDDLDAGEEVIIRREIAVSGKSRAFINDTPVNLEQLRRISELLVDLHRQFDTLSLSDAGFQREVLDALSGNTALLTRYQTEYRQWWAAQQELHKLQSSRADFNKEADYNKFLLDELTELNFEGNELEDMEAELKLLSNSEAIKHALDLGSQALTSGDDPLVHQIRSVRNLIEPFTKYHAGLEEITNRLQSATIELQDIADELEILNSHTSHDPARIETINERLSAGYKLLKKHGVRDTAGLVSIRTELEKKLETILNIDDRIEALEKDSSRFQKIVVATAAVLSEKRTGQIKPLEEQVNRLLTKVGMPNARIKVSISDKSPDIYGKDNIEFLFDANVGAAKSGKTDRFEPIRKVASGGELSRLMLSIKSLVAESMDLPTLIFDEIDTGISGEAAKQVGIIMHGLAESRQLITITHQPQIAGRAFTHLFVYKEKKQDTIRTNIRVLEGEERVTIIAKMLSGEKPTAAALENAREMVMS